MSELRAEVRMNEQGRLVVPAALRQALGLKAGEALVARISDGCLLIERADAVKRRLVARFAKAGSRSLATELIAERRAEARRESRK